MANDERGQASLIALGGVAAVIVLALGLGRVGGYAIDAARASAAADAAALAAAASDDVAAGEIARRNDAELVAVERHGRQVQVRVRVGGVERSARAIRFLVAVRSNR